MTANEAAGGCRNDFLRAAYGAMLLGVAPSRAKSFWQSHPLQIDGRRLELPELLEHVWNGDSRSPYTYLFGVLNDIESFVNESGLVLEEFVDTMDKGLYSTSMFPPRLVLKILAPVAEMLYSVADLRQLVIQRLMPSSARKLFPGFRARVVSHRKAGGMCTSVLMLSWCDPRLQYPSYDVDTFTARILKRSPTVMALPGYEEAYAVGDTRGIDAVVADGQVRDGALWIGGERYGAVVSFSSFCRELGFEIETVGIPDRDVLVAERDYYCPTRRRVVVRAGCAYGTSVALIRFHYGSHEHSRRRDLLSGIIDNALDGETALLKRAADLHRALLESVSEKPVLVFVAREEHLMLNGRTIARDASARILRKLIGVHGTTGRTEFEQRELLRDNTIVTVPKNPNLALRLRRVMELVDSKLPFLQIVRTGRGTFEFRATKPFDYREE